jgi:CO/xanthine dehydrogenase Mo-binding subunit
LLIRERNHLEVTDPLPTGQLVDHGSPGAALLTSVVDAPLPGRRRAGRGASPGGAVRRGVGHALGMTPLLIGEGVENPASATVRYQSGAATIRCAGAELGQGFVTVAMQIVREVLGVESVSLTAVDSDVPSAGPAECGRLTWVAGGAVHAAAVAIADELCTQAGTAQGMSAGLLSVGGGRIRSYDGLLDLALTDVAGSQVIERTAKFSPPATEALDPAGQGVAFAGFGFAAHRAVVEVDVELGLIGLVELVAAVDVGKVVNLTQLLAAVDGGSTAGVVMALGADVADSTVRAPVGHLCTSDLPGTRVADLLERAQDGSWLGVKGVWDTPVGSAAAAVLAAVRDATGAAVTVIPVRPWHLVDLTGDQIGAGSR